MVICWRIHVSQIRQSNETCHRNSDLSDLKRMHSVLRHQFTEMETKYRSVNETKVKICEFLTSRIEQLCPQNWIENENRCYFISTLEKPYHGAREYCSNFDARLLEINSNEEEEFVSTTIGNVYRTYWIGKCRDGLSRPGNILVNLRPHSSQLSGIFPTGRRPEMNTAFRAPSN
ncbi:oxidized low-density lipoprotein receptor 1-like isoform X2 [Hypanus sabinus]|uniref:oxidized low-density lipoprotein receptor 1-like isoform X2 n=1 Tax=Hypanus sabinus TaxID=79690 RepID=UPI0028C4A8F9|nr:oxidized low-density lipoprotein receptor 1-like isoform X2 [Hypanus sabinus]